MSLAELTAFLEKGLITYRLRRFARSWEEQDNAERKRRMLYVRQLCAELDKIQAVSNFGTRVGEMAIEALINGDTRMVSEWAAELSFACESTDLRQQYGPLWHDFRLLLLSAADTSPKDGATRE